jgi:hypothetical protein
MNSITDRVAELSPAKRQLLLQRLKKEAAGRAQERIEAPTFVPVRGNDPGGAVGEVLMLEAPSSVP